METLVTEIYCPPFNPATIIQDYSEIKKAIVSASPKEVLECIKDFYIGGYLGFRSWFMLDTDNHTYLDIEEFSSKSDFFQKIRLNSLRDFFYSALRKYSLTSGKLRLAESLILDLSDDSDFEHRIPPARGNYPEAVSDICSVLGFNLSAEEVRKRLTRQTERRDAEFISSQRGLISFP